MNHMSLQEFINVQVSLESILKAVMLLRKRRNRALGCWESSGDDHYVQLPSR